MKHIRRKKIAQEELFQRLEKLMAEEAPYTDSGLTRKQVAEQLGTNENYLYFALRHALPEDTFSSYINRYRLEHAARILCEYPQAKVESISIDAGFKTRQTFYRLFRERFGMTPNEYRQQQKHISL